MTQSGPLLQVRDLCVRVPGRVLVDALDVDIAPGEFVAVLGQNGSGKSLTLMTLAGLRSASRGEARLNGDDVHASPRQQIARRLALLPQHSDDQFPESVLQSVLAGRHPHIGRFRWESADDLAIAEGALDAMGILAMRDRDVLSLSGGERRRLAIAQVLTQTPQLYLLDEPTNHLDPQHQIDVLRVFRAAAVDGGSVVASLHDANLAMRYADRCLLLYGDGRWELGDVADVLDAERLTGLYNTPIEAVQWRDRSLFVAAGP